MDTLVKIADCVSLDERVTQAETDIRNLAKSILTLTEETQKMQKIQSESLVLMGRILQRLNILKEE